MSLDTDIQKVLDDASLDEETRKKKIRRLKRRYREAADPRPVLLKEEVPSVAWDDYVLSVKEFCLAQGFREEAQPEKPGYGFSLQAAFKGIPTKPEVMLTKFQKRWSYLPKWFHFYHQGTDLILLLGPVQVVQV